MQALRGDDITIFGDGSQTRSFCYVDDMIRGFRALMASGREVTGPVNLGNPAEYTVTELARKVVEMTGSASRVVYRPLPADDPRQRRPDIRAARERLGWAPQVSLEEGLMETILYFDRLLGEHEEAPVPMRARAARAAA